MSTTIEDTAGVAPGAGEGKSGWAHRYADLGSVRIHYVEAGQGPLVIMLHGFPEAWFSYKHQIPALAAAGFHAVAPDMRGYNLSGKPRGVASYRVSLLARDVADLVRACGAERAVVVGHDWGAVVAWNFAMRYPEMLERLVILNVPHPALMLHGLRTMPKQILKSWYIFFFQLPWLPEKLFAARNFAALRRVLRQEPVRPGAFSEADIACYIAALEQPGALTAGINYYRALVRSMFGVRGLRPGKSEDQAAAGARMPRRIERRIEAPVLVIWGEHDRYLSRELAVPPPGLVPNCRVEMLPDASHWVQNDRPEKVNELLLDFLK